VYNGNRNLIYGGLIYGRPNYEEPDDEGEQFGIYFQGSYWEWYGETGPTKANLSQSYLPPLTNWVTIVAGVPTTNATTLDISFVPGKDNRTVYGVTVTDGAANGATTNNGVVAITIATNVPSAEFASYVRNGDGDFSPNDFVKATQVVQTTGTNTNWVISQAANTTILEGLQTQINNAGLFAIELYLSSNKIDAGYSPTNMSYEMCTSQTAGATNFVVTYAATGTYGYVALCTNTIYYTNTAGTATLIDWSSENSAGTLTEKFEMYAFVVGTTNEIERIFSIPYIAYGNTNGYYFGVRCKSTANTSGLLTKTQWLGDGYNTHVQFSQPSSIFTDLFVAKTDIVQTLSGDESNKVPSVAAVNDSLDLKAGTTNAVLSWTAVNSGTNYVYTEYWDATNNVKRFTRTP
jgi:hypothetical protein